MKRFTKLLIGLAGLVGLSACQTANQPLGPGYRDSTEHNFQAQVDDPRPAEGDPTTDARVVDSAIDRYRTGTIEEATVEGDFAAGDGG